MNIGIVTTWFERGASYVSRQYRDTLSLNNNVYIYARGGEEYAFNNETWDKEYVTWGKKSINPVDTAIDIPDFDNWLQKNSIELVFFNEQQCWEPIIFRLPIRKALEINLVIIYNGLNSKGKP